MSCIKGLAAAGLAAAVILLAWLSGCATANQPSDVPWNVPQPWEGVPGGFPSSQP